LSSMWIRNKKVSRLQSRMLQSSRQASESKSILSRKDGRQHNHPIFSPPHILVVPREDSVPTEPYHRSLSPECERKTKRESPISPSSRSASSHSSQWGRSGRSPSLEHNNEGWSASPSARRLSNSEWESCPALGPKQSESPHPWGTYEYQSMRSVSGSKIYNIGGQQPAPTSPVRNCGPACSRNEFGPHSPRQTDYNDYSVLSPCSCIYEFLDFSKRQESGEGYQGIDKSKSDETGPLMKLSATSRAVRSPEAQN
jgi:hypothetical protein